MGRGKKEPASQPAKCGDRKEEGVKASISERDRGRRASSYRQTEKKQSGKHEDAEKGNKRSTESKHASRKQENNSLSPSLIHALSLSGQCKVFDERGGKRERGTQYT